MTFSPFRLLAISSILIVFSSCFGQKKTAVVPVDSAKLKFATNGPGCQPFSTKNVIKPYKEIIPDKAISSKGMFTIHKTDDKWFFEIPDSLFGRDILTVA